MWLFGIYPTKPDTGPLKLKLMTEKWTTKFFFVKICAYTHAHEAKTCTCIYAQSQNMHTHIYASCVHIFTWNVTKIVLIGHYYIMTLSFKFGEDPGFCCRDICQIILNMHNATKRNKCKFALLTSVHARFRLVCACMCTDLYQNLYGGFLLCHKLKFQIS